MGSGNVYAGFFNKQIIGAEEFRDQIFEAVRQENRDFAGQVIGESVVDPAATGLVVTASADLINERRLSIAGTGLTTINDDGFLVIAGDTSPLLTFIDGARTITIQDPDWWTLLPYENAGATLYRVYVQQTKYPIDVNIAKGGVPRGYSRFVDAPGFTVNPDSVVDTGTELRLFIDGNLTALGMQRWLTANTEDPTYSYDCIVYLDTDVVGVNIATDDPDVAIAFTAKLTKVTVGTGWVVDLTGFGDGYLGQSTPTLVAGEYKIAILGALITTTNLDTDPGSVHVATVLSGAGEVINHAGQIIIDSVSNVLAPLATVPNRLHHKSWLSPLPSIAISGGGANIDFGVGSAFVDGAIAVTPVSSLTGFAINSTLFIAYNNTSGVLDYQVFGTYDLANVTSHVPIVRFETGGTGLVTQIDTIGRLVELYNETLFITLSDTTEHRAEFANLKDALAYAAALRSSAISPKDIVIDIIGDITVADNDTITEPEFLGLRNITFRGVGGGNIRNAVSQAQAGARIIWSDVDDGLFELNDAPTLIEGWRFENITFRYTGTAVADDVGVIVVLDGGMDGVVFDGCTFDGSTVLTAQGGGNGLLPHVIHYASTAFPPCHIVFDQCAIYTRDAFYNNVGDDGTRGLKVFDCDVVGQGAVPAFTNGGAIRDAFSTGGLAASEFIIRNNNMVALNGLVVDATKLKSAWLIDNRMESVANASMLDLGNSASDDDVEDVFIHDNTIKNPGLASAIPMISIITQDPPTGSAVIRIHDNVVDGGNFAGSVGLSINDGQGAGTRGVSIHHNVFRNVGIGVRASLMEIAQVNFNQIEALTAGIEIDGVSGSESQLMASMNQIILTGTDGIGVDMAGANIDDRYIVAFNHVNMDGTAGSTNVGVNADGTSFAISESLIVGNLIQGGDFGVKNDMNKSVIGLNVIAGTDIGIEHDTSSNIVVCGNSIDPLTASFRMLGAGGLGASIHIGNNAPSVLGQNEIRLGNVGILCGNRFEDLEFGTTIDAVITGNYFADLDSTLDGGSGVGIILSSNRMFTYQDDPAVDNLIFANNLYDDSAVTAAIFSDEGVVSGNLFAGDLLLDSFSSFLIVDSNRIIGSTLTDDGTSNVLGDNNIL